MSTDFKSSVTSVVVAVQASPKLLTGKPSPTTLALLQTQANLKAQGTGNKVTDQEGRFAETLEKHGFIFRDKHAALPPDGHYYSYQVKGSQKAGDFAVEEICGGAIKKQIILDLKHTLSKNFYFNDGWFEKGVIYIISWQAGTKKKPDPRCHVGLGEDIPTEEESSFMRELVAFKQAKNAGTTKIGSLRPYIRFANQYSCAAFPAAAADHLAKTVAWIGRNA